MKKTQTLMNKSFYIILSILDLSKTVFFNFLYDYVKLKYDEKEKLCYTGTSSFIVHVKKKDDIYKDFEEYVQTRYDTSNDEFDRPLPEREKKESSWFNERTIRW